MDQDSAWGTDIEMLTLAHLLNTSILSYSVEHGSWQRYSPYHVDRSLVDDFQQMSMYITIITLMLCVQLERPHN